MRLLVVIIVTVRQRINVYNCLLLLIVGMILQTIVSIHTHPREKVMTFENQVLQAIQAMDERTRFEILLIILALATRFPKDSASQ